MELQRRVASRFRSARSVDARFRSTRSVVFMVEGTVTAVAGKDYWYEEAKMALQRRVAGSVDARSRSARSVVLMVEGTVTAVAGRDYWYEEAKMALQRRVAGSVDARSRSARSVVLMVEGTVTVVAGRDYWYEEAKMALQRRVAGSVDARSRSARSVVLMVGDGMGMSTVTAARILKGQRLGQTGEDTNLAWDKFPATALAKTYNLDGQVGESSACATALMCGVKANLETVGLDAGGRFDNCFSSLNSQVESLVDWAHRAGKWTGVVTSARVTHATPAALYSHSASRYWEDDSKVPPEARTACKDIARQLVEDDPGNNITVILGGGRRHWLPKGTRDPDLPAEDGRRLDGRNLIEDWLRDNRHRGLRAEYVQDRAGLEAVDRGSVDRLLGLFSYSHLEFEADRDRSPSGDPSLAEMADVAVSLLQRSPHGFFLFVESGRIDHAHHYNNAYRALDETLALEAALLNLLSVVDLTETLFVVTSDHSNVMTFGGLSTPRGNPILGADTKVSDMDGLPYSTLLYGNGPGYGRPRLVPSNLTDVSEERNVVQGSAVPRQWATHGGEDVPVYAQGPLASVVFKGVVEQSYVPHAIAYVLCLGQYSARCRTLNQTAPRQGQACITPEVTGGQARGGKVLASSQGMHSGSAPPRAHHHYWSALLLAVLSYSPLT